MEYNIIITSTAKFETLDAYSYYELQQTGLGDLFLHHVEIAYAKIKNNPNNFGYISTEKNNRDLLLTKFPYLVIYKIDYNDIIILSIFQANQNPFKKPK